MGVNLQIITPEQVIFEGEVDAVSVPGKRGRFQMLSNHAPIVSTLGYGKIQIHTHSQEKVHVLPDSGKLTQSATDDKVLELEIDGGIIELSNNQLIILAE